MFKVADTKCLHNALSFALVAALSAAICSCGCGDKTRVATERAGKYARQITELENANVAAEVDANLKKGDQRFVGVMEFGLELPACSGIETIVEKQYGVRIIDNTSDAIENAEHERLQLVAERYAEKYNQRLREKLGL